MLCDEMIEEVGRFVCSLWICVLLFYFVVNVDPFSLLKQREIATSGLLNIELPDDEPPSCLELAMCTCVAAISKAITSHVNLEAMSPGLNQEDWSRWIDFF